MYEPPTRLLRVDLDAETVESEAVPGEWRRRFVGGKGLGARYLYEELDAGVDPLGAENALLFVLGPLSGVLPGDARYAVVTKSPLTGAFLDSYGGGTFPGRLVGALGDHLGVLVTGAADRPVRLEVADGTAHVRPADGLWGEDTRATDAAFPDAGVACIGPAGERRVRYATIASDGGEHQAGRGGAGAVMGSKRLKAVVARGRPPDALAELRQRLTERFTEDEENEWYLTSETLETVDFADEIGALATRGWREREFEGADDIGIEAASRAASERERRDEPIPGGFRVETDAGESVPRGATPMSLGAGLGIDDFDAVAALGETCDRLGIDVISAGTAVAWAIRAEIAADHGRDLDFGDPEDARRLLEDVAARETELGDALAEGVARAARRYGGEDLVPTVKGMALPAYDPRGAVGMALAYATSDRGACHRRALPVETEALSGASWTPADTARLVAHDQDVRSILWSLVADDFVGRSLRETLGAEWLRAAGMEFTPEQLLRTGERIWTLTRLFNLREGFTRADDDVPDLLLDSSAGDGVGGQLDAETFEAMLDAYYAVRGWDAAGRPTRATLEAVGLADVVDEATPTGSRDPG
ncbi:aldehyde ferredoxin oxidoreductase family protein [Halomicrococcus gelatinilyticus]|uniref:aldehyde ferredoxin oxidoreductase family protein n=1 Tax=Halomicrococcus gelatinilyticus TaxID=1702103 RepID=UPI002E1081F0